MLALNDGKQDIRLCAFSTAIRTVGDQGNTENGSVNLLEDGETNVYDGERTIDDQVDERCFAGRQAFWEPWKR